MALPRFTLSGEPVGLVNGRNLLPGQCRHASGVCYTGRHEVELLPEGDIVPSHIILVDDDEVYRCLNVATLESADNIVHAFPDFRGVTELVDSGAPVH
jgi:hypothetical protein